ncbi:unnamed protein product [Kluyveromyces dobzhanskii CBS 2104]|uniref:WGS project CCBQ000000000 data, contig 00028 n=1 Tax=Kluyveromyces dobzhanskii CBS 2104 TaxID=1427455 RepID=A0A0A8L0E0_9SACH|nr:unnamed protein product [Kluyveromyces dobzhanskii CBS 2104]
MRSKIMSIPFLLESIQSPHKEEREDAENTLLKYCAADPPSTFMKLIEIATYGESAVNIKQLALLCLRKFITMHWSAGFPSFVGPPGVGEQGKDVVRRGLLSLLANEDTENKVVSTVTYCIVQICAVDFPDEWPGLLDYLNEIILEHHSENAMSLLTELVEDIITNEMFYDNYSGAKIVNTVLLALNNANTPLRGKSKLLKLYQHCLSQLHNSQTFITSELMEEWVLPHLRAANGCIDKLLEEYETNVESEAIQFKGDLFKVLIKLFDINQNLLGSNGDLTFRLRMALSVIKSDAGSYVNALEDNQELRRETINASCINTVQYLAYIPSDLIESIALPDFTDDFIKLCLLPEDHLDLLDFNEFISKETGLSASYNARDEIGNYLSSCSDTIYYSISESILQKCLNIGSNDPKFQESCLFLFQELCSNETSMEISRYQDFLSLSAMILDDGSCPVFVKSRAILTVPKFFENNMECLPDIKQLIQQFLTKTINCTLPTEDEILLSSLVISFTYYTSFAELGCFLDQETSLSLQRSVIKAIQHLYEDCEEDSLGLLLEAVHEIVKSWHTEQDFHTKEQILNLLLMLSSSEPSNVRIVFESVRSLPYLLKTVNAKEYSKLCEHCFPSFTETMSVFIQNHQTYSPLVVLALEFLSVFLKNPPVEKSIPSEVIEYVLHPIVSFINECPDENMVETALQAFAYMACNSDPKYWKNLMFELSSFIFAPERSLYKVIDVSPIMLLSLRIAQPDENIFLEQIMHHAMFKLVDPNKLHPIDTSIIIFCEIILQDVQRFLTYIFSISENAGRPIAEAAIHELLKCFEENRSTNMLKEVALALSTLYFSNDQRLTESKYYDESDDTVLSFKEYTAKIFADELTRQAEIEEAEDSEIAPEDYEEDYVAQLNDDVALLTGRTVDIGLRELLIQFLEKAHQLDGDTSSNFLDGCKGEVRSESL